MTHFRDRYEPKFCSVRSSESFGETVSLARQEVPTAAQGGVSMSRQKLSSAFSVVLTALMMPSLYAQDQRFVPNGMQTIQPPARIPDRAVASPMSQPAPSLVSYSSNQAAQMGQAPTPIDANRVNAAAPAVPVQQQGYVRLGAPMYPTPRPNIPIWSGSTVVTNQAFAPQEMLYPHTYRSIYPPFYHKVKGGWIVTPMGVRSHEKWELQGTMVQVKYRSSYPGLFSGAFWLPPATSHYSHGNRY